MKWIGWKRRELEPTLQGGAGGSARRQGLCFLILTELCRVYIPIRYTLVISFTLGIKLASTYIVLHIARHTNKFRIGCDAAEVAATNRTNITTCAKLPIAIRR